MDRAWSTQLKKGLVELTVLAALRKNEAYGYELLQRLSLDPLLATTESTLYPMLSRLTDERLISVRQADSPSGPPRRYYRLTPRGQEHLKQLSRHWHQLSSAVDSLLDGQSRGEDR
jgi:PadR family transcriptional regulator, regulatory protein PadR